MIKILMSLLTVILVGAAAVGATNAWYVDTETSNDNTFTSASLDLTADGNNGTNDVRFTVSNMKPGDQPTSSWTLANIGNVGGYLDIENISVTSNENGCVESETEAGDSTCDNPGLGQGELQDVVNLRLYVDRDKDGYWSTGDYMIYNGPVGAIASSYDLNEAIAASGNARINAVLDWWSTANDSKAMGDNMTVNLTYELGQTTGQ